MLKILKLFLFIFMMIATSMFVYKPKTKSLSKVKPLVKASSVKKRYQLPHVVYHPEKKNYPHLKASDFSQLPKWDNSDTVKSLQAFRQSCQVWSKQDPNKKIGNSEIPLLVKDWLPICEQANRLGDRVSGDEAKQFFETFFKPYHWTYKDKGLFTGYYSPVVQGSLSKTSVYKTPLYATPSSHVVSRFSRQQIYNGALAGKAKVIAWLKSPLDAMALEIEGSGMIKVGQDKHFFVGYDAENGKRYHSIAQLLINSRVISRAKASMANVKAYFVKHPEKINTYVAKNPSYVYFKTYMNKSFKGAQGAPLTPHYSLAVDRRYIPLGLPLYLSTTSPTSTKGDIRDMHRLMVAQDVGGSIKGAVRGDIYWGAGERATQIASLMESSGQYWLLLPRSFTVA
jgi:membrane-bound lytic murein transglycosylase A